MNRCADSRTDGGKAKTQQVILQAQITQAGFPAAIRLNEWIVDLD